MANTQVRIAFMAVLGFGHSSGWLRGLLSFARTRPNWRIRHETNTADGIRAVCGWGVDGIIAHLYDLEMARAICGMGKPVVNISSAISDFPVPRVSMDNVAIGEQAGRHLLERGFKHFAYIGYSNRHFTTERYTGYARAIQAAGYTVHRYDSDSSRVIQGETNVADNADIERWLRGLHKPLGLMACNDVLGHDMLRLIENIGLHVPDQIAVIGVDNDDLACNFAHPPLSSVRVPWDLIGYEAAVLLDRILSGRRLAEKEKAIRLPPQGVMTRQSTDVLAVPDADVSTAVRFIREHFSENISVDDVLEVVPISRRSLEQKFRAVLNCTPLQEIHRMRMDRAKDLLTHTGLTVFAVAKQCGFSSLEHFSRMFKASEGVSPARYRLRARLPQ
ncbi:MAG TPA: DNA-binding transcriptional regulator [Planctomycetota bacterium]|nr:DNA-binding transcriptional regulator [Planctomycetota bacterium]